MTAKEGNPCGSAKLSKNLLQMKFMKRTALKAEEEEQKEQKKIVEDAEHWTVPDLGHRERSVICEPGYTTLEELRFGRMSFRGFNPSIEKIMKLQNTELRDAESEKREKQNAVSEDEMAERYNSLIQTMNKKFAKKNGGKNSGRNSRQEKKEKVQNVPADRRKRNKKFEKAANRGRAGDEEKEDEEEEPTPKRKREFKKPKD